ncbi:hypothetical protein OG234_13465 [Streptomyces sp. NBC_01420]|uniref:hypothetical protein n=1 Tax=Streptomyces sp. NBC_01420 TaxID=2903858 RepID=UPI0032550A04
MTQEQPEEVRRLEEAIEALNAIEDDEACAQAVSLALDAWPEHGKRLAAIRRERVNRLHDQRRLSWASIGALLKRRDGKGVSGARAQQIGAGLSGHSASKRKEEKKAAEGQE